MRNVTWRGTWKNPGKKTWHEIDGFAVRKTQRSRLVKRIKTVTVQSPPTDHLPKRADLWLLKETKERMEKAPPKVDWDALTKTETAIKFAREIDVAFGDTSKNWVELKDLITKVGKQVCGAKKKAKLCPWLDANAERIQTFQQKLESLTGKIKSASSQEEQSRARENRRVVRRQYKRKGLGRTMVVKTS